MSRHDIFALQNSFRRHLRHTLLEKEEYARLIRRAEKMDKKDVYKNKQHSLSSQKKSVCSVSIEIVFFLESAGLSMWGMLPSIYVLLTMVGTSTYPPSPCVRNYKEDCNSVFIICHNFGQPVMHRKKWRPLIHGRKFVLPGSNAFLIANKIQPEVLD